MSNNNNPYDITSIYDEYNDEKHNEQLNYNITHMLSSPVTIDWPGKVLRYDKYILDKLFVNHYKTHGEPNYDTVIQIENHNILDATIIILDSELTTPNNIMIVNMSSVKKLSTGVKYKASKQETLLEKCTNLNMVIPECLYPLSFKDVILNRNIFIVKDSEYNIYYPYPNKMYHFNCLTYTLNSDSILDIEKKDKIEYDILVHKMEMIFITAYLNGYDTLVFGELKYYTYNDKDFLIADIILDMLLKYSGYFKNIVFAIPENTNKYNNDILCKYIIQEYKKYYKEKYDEDTLV